MEIDIQNIKLTVAFVAEAAIDIVKLQARVMMSSVTAKRALWLRCGSQTQLLSKLGLKFPSAEGRCLETN